MQYKGIIYILISSLTYAVVNFCVKYLQEFPTHEIVFFRSLVSVAISVVMIKQLKLPMFGNNKKWLIIRGFTGMSALFLFFLTIKHIPLASATTIQYLSPIFTVLLATQMQGEKVKKAQWFLFGLAFIGVFLIKGFDDRVSLMYLLLGILSSLISGIAYNAIMKCRQTDHPVTVVFYFPLIAVPVMGVACLIFGWKTPQGIEWLLLLVMGIFTQIAQIYMTKALHADHSSRIMPFKYFGVIYALLIGIIWFGEFVPFASLMGIALVIIAVIANTLVKNPNKKLPGTQGLV